jgi:replication fork protection complex subunit Tof1/Swi1
LIDADELEWYVPAAILPAELQRSLNVINQFLQMPLDLGGKKAKELLSKKARRRRRARRSPSTSDSDTAEDEPKQKKKREKKEKEKETYKSAQFIEDSDEEYGDMDAFLEKEKQLRERTTAKAAAEGSTLGTMKATGTKKRRKKDGKGGNKKRKGEPDVREEEKADSDDSDIGVLGKLEEDDAPNTVATPKQKPRPRPRPKPRVKNSLDVSSPLKDTDAAPLGSPDISVGKPSSPASSPGLSSIGTTKRKIRIVISDDEE